MPLSFFSISPFKVMSIEPAGLTMRYWVLSVRALSLYLSNKEAPSPKLLATGQLTLGGTCWQSPKTTTCLDELNVTMGIIHSGSEAMPQLSITTWKETGHDELLSQLNIQLIW